MTSIIFAEYSQFKTNFREFIVSMRNVCFHVEKLSFAQRMHYLTTMETAYWGLWKFSSELQSEMIKEISDKSTLRYFQNALARSNYIKLENGKVYDYFITAPPLGDRYWQNAAMISYLTDRALETAAKAGMKFNQMSEICIIVKQYCNCDEVAMGTTENREIHSITDTILKRMGLDDNPWIADVCYVWAESPQPRTEIVITAREYAQIYDEFVTDTAERPLTKKKENKRHEVRKNRMHRNVEKISAIISEVNDFIITYNDLEQETCLQLSHLAKCLAEIICDLRAPFVSSAKHEFSKLYSVADAKSGKTRNTMQKGESREMVELDMLFNENSKYDDSTFIITVKTPTPRSLKYESGKDLAEIQEHLLIQRMPLSAVPIGFHAKTDLVVTINRHLAAPIYHTADSDNLNTNFLRQIAKRVKIIYVKTVKSAQDITPDCTITMAPKGPYFRF